MLLKMLFWRVANNTNEKDFKNAMLKIERHNKEAHTCLQKIGALHWSRHAFDLSIKYDHNTNNNTKSFNGCINRHKKMLILTMIEKIRRKVMKKTKKRFKEVVL